MQLSRGILASVLGAGILFLPGRSVSGDAPEPLLQQVTKSVTHLGVLQFVICHLEPGMWGGSYEAKVKVGGRATVDNKPRVFEVSKGKFSETLATEWVDSLASVERKGTVSLTNQEEAFKRGVPFFLSDVSLEPTGLLHYTVASNPSAQIARAMPHTQNVPLPGKEPKLRLQWQIVGTPQAFSSAPEPQKRTFKIEPKDLNEPDSQMLFSIVTYADDEPCLASNEVDLTALAASGK